MHTMVFKAPGPHKIHGHQVTYKVIPDADVEAHQTDGWHLTAIQAGEARAAAVVAAAEASLESQAQAAAQQLADNAKPPTREELEQMAAKLSLPFSARVSDRKLRGLIDAALAQA